MTQSTSKKENQEDVQHLEQDELQTLVESNLKSNAVLASDEPLSTKEMHDAYANIASQVAQKLVQELSNKDSKFLSELKNIVQSIDSAKDEIASIRPKELTENELPDAANSLDVIIQTSEEACENILGCAEELMEIAEFVPSKLQTRLTDISTKLFESSNFDDLNGQRVRKVIKTLRLIEDRLKGLLDIYGETYDAVAPNTSEPEKTDDEKLMNGPQDKNKAATQAEIDDILNSF